MYQLLNDPKEKGGYAYSGTPIVSNRVSFHLSQKQVRWLIHKVKEFTKNQPRDFILTFEDDTNEEKIFVIDHFTPDELDDISSDGNLSRQQITALNHYSIIYEHELPNF